MLERLADADAPSNASRRSYAEVARKPRGEDFEALPRVEGEMLLGDGLFVDDICVEGAARGYVLRSPYPHARIKSVATSAARQSAGVLAVLTGVDLASIAKPLPCMIPLKSFGGKARAEADRVILATDRVRHVGDGVAFVVAETLHQAMDAAALIEVDYEVLPPCLDPGAAEVKEPVWADVPDNCCFDWRFGDADACRRLFDSAAHVVRMTLSIPRIVVNPVEPRAAIGLHDAETDDLTLIANTQGVHFVRSVLAKSLGIAQKSLRVLTPNVGGAFGSKIYAYPEHVLVLVAARLLGRPVRWTSGRREAILSDTQGRGHVTQAALALDAGGRFLALSVKPTVDLGAYLSQLTPLTATGVGAPVQGGAYRFRAIEIQVRGVFTNKVPIDAFRGAGRPEANYVLERLIDRTARVLGIDPAALRARNLPDAQIESLTTVTGLVVDGGRFLDNQRRCLDVADRSGFEARRRAAAERGLLRGFGFAHYLEANGGIQVAKAIDPDSFPIESAALRFGRSGALDIVIGTQSSGQDHARPMALHAAEAFGLDPLLVTVREGDSNALAVGSGTGGSKSLLTSSVALAQAVTDVLSRARALLAKEWGVKADVLRFADGVFSIPASNRAASIQDIAMKFPGALDGESRSALLRGSSANGCHACEVEIDRETGDVRIIRYVAVDDFGVVVNEGAVRGQVQGGVAQGIGQVLMECAPSPEALTWPVATSPFALVLPRATDIPVVEWSDNGLPSRTNIFGAKACGELGASAAPPTVMNAISNALDGLPGASDLQMPARPSDIWRIIHSFAGDQPEAPRR